MLCILSYLHIVKCMLDSYFVVCTNFIADNNLIPRPLLNFHMGPGNEASLGINDQ